MWSNLEIYRATKIADNLVDVAMLHNILFQTKKRIEVVKEAVRMIKPGGKLLVVDWQLTGAPFGPRVEDRVAKQEVKNIAQELGLKLREEFVAGPYHYGLIFKK